MNDVKVGRVVLAGATHGNEWIGAVLVKRWQQAPESIRRSSFESVPLLANPGALAAGRRYLDQDLNRSFATPDPGPQASREARRAHEILSRFGPRGSTPADLVLDLHTTTSNMGLSYITTSRDPFNLRMAAWVQRHEPRLRVYLWIDETMPKSSLSSIVPRGATIEVGPTPNNVLRADLLLDTGRVVELCLDFVEAHNRGELEPWTGHELEVFTHLASYDYPRDGKGELVAVVHPALQDRDYQPLDPGDPVFLGLDGNTHRFEGTERVYPVFINEAAYYEKGLAFSVTRRDLLFV